MSMEKIGIYDSGCGGLSVLRVLINRYAPKYMYYFSDSGNNPWGNKSKDTLYGYLTTIHEWFQIHGITHVVTGCNTTVSLFSPSELEALFKCPVTTLFDSTRDYYNATHYTVLSTENSCKHQLFTRFLAPIPAQNIEEIACPNVAGYIESQNDAAAIAYLDTIIAASRYPHIILGCTHYPLVLRTLANNHPSKIIIDPSHYLRLPFTPATCPQPQIMYTTSGSVQALQHHFRRYTTVSSSQMHHVL